MNIKKTTIITTIYSFISFSIFGFSSDLIQKMDQKKEVKTYYYKHLSNLRKSVPPRRIHYIDAQNIKRYGSFHIEGILFTYQNPGAKKVYLVNDFDKYKKHPMIRNQHGVFYAIFIPNKYLLSQKRREIKYKFKVDGMFDYDHTHNLFESDGANSLISLYYLQPRDIKPGLGSIDVDSEKGYSKKYLFRIYAPDAKEISLVGNFNQWNSDLDIMERKESGYFEYVKYLSPGEYIYLFKIDGKYELDKNNLSLRNHQIFGRTNYLRIEKQ